jgi:hypothetical protein
MVGSLVPQPAPATALKVRSGDAVLTPALVKAIKRWQGKAGLPQTGTIDPANVVVQPQEVRVTAVKAALGDPASADLMTVSSTAKLVTAELAQADAGAVKPGTKVALTLPDSSTTPGTVSGVVALPAEAGSNQEDKLSVSVTVDNGAAIKSLDAGSVRVEFTGDVHKGVLAVPVGALLALSEGGYALQIPGGGLVAVKTGLFAKGMVEVTGAGITDGTKVVTAS